MSDPTEQELIRLALSEGALSSVELERARQAQAGAQGRGEPLGLLQALGQQLEPGRRARLSELYQRVQAARARGPWQPGATLPGGLLLVEALGAGGMGEVFLARDPSGAEVAVKALDRDAHPVLAERFAREGEAQARVDGHPHVLRVRSAGLHVGRAFLVMDYAGGGDLRARVKAGPLALAEVLTLGIQLSDALAHTHAQGVLHRDLKPANVLLDAAGQPKLADFGLAGLEGAETLTQTGTSLGTPGYMAPEQVDSKRGTIGPATDVYGLGALLFDLACGRPPFRADSRMGLIARLLTEPPPRLRQLRPDASAGLEAVVERCLQKDPVARYPTMRDLHQALREVEAGRGPRPARSWGGVAGLGLGLLGLGLLGLGLGSLGLGSLGLGSGATRRGGPTPRPTSSRVAASPPPSPGVAPLGRARGAPLWRPLPAPRLYRLRYERRRFVTAERSVLLRIDAYFTLRCESLGPGAAPAQLQITRLRVDFRGAEMGQQRYDTEHPMGHSDLSALDAGVGARLEGQLDPQRGQLQLAPAGVEALSAAVRGELEETRTLDALAKDAGLPPLREILKTFMSPAFLNRCLRALTQVRGPEALPWRERGGRRQLSARRAAPLPLIDEGALPARVELSGAAHFEEGRYGRGWVEQQIEAEWRRSYRCELELDPGEPD